MRFAILRLGLHNSGVGVVNPALPNKIHWPALWGIGGKFELDPMVPREALILSSPEVIQELAVEVVNDVRDYIPAIVDRLRERPGPSSGDEVWCGRRQCEALIRINFGIRRMIDSEQRVMVHIVCLPVLSRDAQIVK